MDRPTWDRIQEIYYSTLPMAPSERMDFVANACDQNPLLFHEVSSLLEAEKSAGNFLESSVFEVGLKIISSSNGKNAIHSTFVDNLVGTTISKRYLVEKQLGHGGIGKVYLARDLELHSRPVVIKVLLEASLQDPYVVKKFHQEVEALARLDHPNVVSVLGAGELVDGKPFIVMQCVSGVTLRSQIVSEGMQLERTALILKQIGAALDDVHEKGILHRDLKPENIMVQLKRSTELVKIVDFGIAKVKDSVVAPSTVNEVPVGTLLYMSPEQLRGGTKLTAASDIYSMGVIAYEMITGRRPFNPASGPQLLEMHRDGVRVKPIDLRTSLSTEAQAIVLRALSFDPSARYQSASELGDRLARALLNDHETADFQNSLRPLTDSPKATFNTPAKVQLPAEATDSCNASVVPVVRSSRLTGFFRNRAAVIGSLLMLVICAGALYYKYFGGVSDDDSIPGRSFTYWLTVQKMRDNKEYGQPFQSSGQEIFESGDKFRFNVNSPDPGYLYLFNEGPPTTDGISFTLIYPTPETSSAAVGANQSISTNWNTFAGQPGTENFWIVWADTPVHELESAKTQALSRPNGALAEQDRIAVREYLKTMQSEVKLKTARDRVSRMITVRGSGKVLVRLAELEHR